MLVEENFKEFCCSLLSFILSIWPLKRVRTKGGSYIEAVINAWGISDDDLLCNVASRLRNKTFYKPYMATTSKASG